MEKKEYETPKAEFFRVEESIFCLGSGEYITGSDGGVGWEEEGEPF